MQRKVSIKLFFGNAELSRVVHGVGRVDAAVRQQQRTPVVQSALLQGRTSGQGPFVRSAHRSGRHLRSRGHLPRRLLRRQQRYDEKLDIFRARLAIGQNGTRFFLFSGDSNQLPVVDGEGAAGGANDTLDSSPLTRHRGTFSVFFSPLKIWQKKHVQTRLGGHLG